MTLCFWSRIHRKWVAHIHTESQNFINRERQHFQALRYCTAVVKEGAPSAIPTNVR